MRKIFFLSLLVSVISLASVHAKDVYLFSYFTGNGDGLHLTYSYDGLEWLPLFNKGAVYLKPVIGKDKLLRDPSIWAASDGTFHMVWTSGWWDQGIGYASSKDLINWSEQKNIPVMEYEPTTRNTWAPELFYDDASRLYYIVWASTIPGRHSEVATSASENGLNHRLYYVTTKDFSKFSETKMFFNPTFSAIDGAIIKFKGTYYMIVKNENSSPPEKNLRVTSTTKMENGFPVEVSAPITGNYWAEGPTPLAIDDYVYVYFDKYRDHQYGAVRSKDMKTWEDVSDQIKFPQGVRHGTAFKVSEAVLAKLLANER